MQWRPQGLWQHPDFVKLWTGRAISELGSRITREGLPLTAALLLAATPEQMGLLAAMSAVPVLLVGLFAGVWVDRRRRRPIMIATDLGRAALLLSIPAAALLGQLHIEHLYLVAAGAGVLALFFNIADQSFLPVLVSREHLVEGNSKLAGSGAVAEIGGPVLAGVLVQVVTAPIAIALDALSFLASAVSVSAIRTPEPPPAPPTGQPRFWPEVRAGLDIVLHHPILRALAVTFSIQSFFGGFYAALYVLYAVRVVGVSPALLGVLIAGGGLGSLLGAVLAGPMVRRFGLGATMVGASLVGAAVAFSIPLAGLVSFPVAVALLLVGQIAGDCADDMFWINAVSLRQLVTPDHLLGRMNASMAVLSDGVYPFGILLGGALGGLIGVQATVVIAALGSLFAAAWVIVSPIRRLHAHPAPLPPEPGPALGAAEA